MVLSQASIVKEGNLIKILKKYNGIKSSKWTLFSFMRIFYPFATFSKGRLERELDFLQAENDIKKPKIYNFDIENRKIYKEYIDGEIDNCDGSSIGRTMSDIHRNGYTLGDSKLGNFICRDSNAYVIDAEQARYGGEKKYMYWDVSLLILSAAYRNYSYTKSFKSFITGFSKNYAYWDEYKKSALKGVSSLLFLLMPVQHIKTIKEEIYKNRS